ncbi:MAG: DNA polymerase/3'-5' exonuclease PolX [Acidobacteria bacterium]|nr:DNA polymerase/3'-5' exonuclease PolX [Acidobacteriota bacterium]
MDNHKIAQILTETADLMEIDGADGFRIRSYRNACQALETMTEQAADIAATQGRHLTDVPAIGKSMAAHIEEILRTGKLSVHKELLQKLSPVALEMLKVQGLGPKGIATVLSHFKVASLGELETLARQGKLRDLPRMGEKLEQKIIRSLESLQQTAGRRLIDVADHLASELADYLKQVPDVKSVTAAGSLRRGCETVGDIDLLVSGGDAKDVATHFLKHPQIADVIAQGENKISVHLKEGIQVDVRMLEESCHGAALQYFTGSKLHNVALRDRAKRMGYKLNEYGLFRIQDEKLVAAATEEEIYSTLGLAYIEPELRENTGELDAAEVQEDRPAQHPKLLRLPTLLRLEDMRGDLHMHSTASDGKFSITEMAEAARLRGLEYVAITDHSKLLAMANGLNENRLLEQIKQIRSLAKQVEGIRILCGTEVDILADGSLDLEDAALAELDVVVGSVHSHMNQPAEQMTERILKAIENPNLCIIGHPTGRLQLRRDPFPFDMEAVLKHAKRHGVAMEINSFPDRLDLRDTHVRMCKEIGVKLVISTDSHHTRHLSHMKYGVLTARRGWLEKSDVLNTLPAEKFLAALRKSG